LRQLSTLVPVDRRRNPELTNELLGRTPERGEDVVRKLQLDPVSPYYAPVPDVVLAPPRALARVGDAC